MKRFVVGLALVVTAALTTWAGAAFAEAPKDVPADHPAYQAVQSLVDKGYLALFQDGSFQGGKPADRYTLALVVSRLMSDVQSGKLVLSNEEMKTLRQLATDFRAELVELAARNNNLAKTVEKTQADVVILKDDDTRLLAEVYQIEANLGKLSDVDTANQAATAQLANRVAALEGQVPASSEKLAERIAAQEKGLSAVNPQFEQVQSHNKVLEESVSSLKSDFETYRKASEAEVADLKQKNKNILIGGGIVALLLMFR